MTHPRYSAEEIARLGEEIYQCRLRERVEPEHNGGFLVLDIETGGVRDRPGRGRGPEPDYGPEPLRRALHQADRLPDGAPDRRSPDDRAEMITGMVTPGRETVQNRGWMLIETVYIVFDNRGDEATGLVELARRTRVDAFPGGVYALREADLRWLDELGLCYRLVTDAEVGSAVEELSPRPH